ncbi:MAG: SpoIIE family protein phosphatase [Labilithrix sp.]|nr:SpoIIE family protein phosphatase [Labilithrix sp.]MBX3213883.1 SpoIIE family protein phosphatase [Labilithrix sp.]
MTPTSTMPWATERRGGHANDLSFQVEAVDGSLAGDSTRTFRDAVRLRPGYALLLVLDFADLALAASERARWKHVVRSAGARSDEPDTILRVLNGALFDAGLKATASCAVLDARDNLLSVACAGASPPWVLRARERVVRVQTSASIELGSLRGAAFATRRLHFAPRDALLLPSAAWVAHLDATLAEARPASGSPADWLRARPAPPPDGCVLCMTLR